MLSPELAIQKIIAQAKPLPACKMDLRKADGLVLASSIRCPDSLPRFDNSAVDGYALRFVDTGYAKRSHPVWLRVIAEIHAGSRGQPRVKGGRAIRIATGARVPPGADAVVMQENCLQEGSWIQVSEPLSRWENIRRKGEEIRKGQIALQRGQTLNPGSIAWLATMGMKNVSVHRLPKVGLLRSGNEVVDWGKSPRPHQVRDAHGISLPLALQRMGIEIASSPLVDDQLKSLIHTFSNLLGSCDLVMTTGGVSVGDRDLFHAAAAEVGMKVIFSKVSQKPGKPMVFGRLENKLWFGLPGNPVASLVCFHLYVKPCLLKMMGHSDPLPQWFETKAGEPFLPNAKRTDFLRGCLQNGKVTFAEKQGSHCLGSFADANVLVKIPPSIKPGKPGATVQCMWLDG